MTIPNWSSDPLAIDVAVTSPLTKASVRLGNPCEEYAANQKHRKYDVSFQGFNYSFCAMVFETLGALNSEGTEVLKQMFCFAAKHLGREFTSYCVRAWARVSCTLQRSVAQAILNRSSSRRVRRPIRSSRRCAVLPGGPSGDPTLHKAGPVSKQSPSLSLRPFVLRL